MLSRKKSNCIQKDEYLFCPSRIKFKKYDVYSLATKKKIASFGDNRYEQYYDAIGFYTLKNHGDKKRKKRYYQRHGSMKKTKKETPKWFSHKYLW